MSGGWQGRVLSFKNSLPSPSPHKGIPRNDGEGVGTEFPARMGLPMTAPYTPTEIMTVAAARALRNDDVVLRRHRRAVGRLQPRPADPRAGDHADLRIRHHRHQAGRAAAVDRRRRTLRHGADHRLGAGDVPLLAAGRAHHGRLPRRRADRPLRQPQHHRGRPLRQAEGAAARRRRRAGDRRSTAARSSSPWRCRRAPSSTSSPSSPRSATARDRAAARRSA